MGCVASALWWDLGRLPRPQRWHLLACRPTWQERDLCHPVAASFGPTAVFLPSGMKIEPSILFVLMNDSQAAVCLEDKAPAAGWRPRGQQSGFAGRRPRGGRGKPLLAGASGLTSACLSFLTCQRALYASQECRKPRVE